MRIVIMDCEATYKGRLGATLARGVRLLMIKEDGCVSIHSDDGAYRPLNWMNAPNTVTVNSSPSEELEAQWVVISGDETEQLTIDVHKTLSDSEWMLAIGGLTREGVEADLQEHLAANPSLVEIGLTLVRREYPTPVGPVDLMCLDSNGDPVAVEVKRHCDAAGIEQVCRYVETLKEVDSAMQNVRPILAALKFAPQARRLAKSRGVKCVTVDKAGKRVVTEHDLPRLV